MKSDLSKIHWQALKGRNLSAVGEERNVPTLQSVGLALIIRTSSQMYIFEVFKNFIDLNEYNRGRGFVLNAY